MPNSPFDNVDLPDPTDPSDVVNDLEPEVVDGPLGLPVVKPRGLPGPDRFTYDDDEMMSY